jgi:two-component system, OmpR family, copper resistance phosphate regulon response regulator CusR
MRVLLVEDDRELADYVRRGLEEEAYSVQACFDGSSGLRAAERSAFDIIVLDVMLPFMDGLEVTRRLRRGGVRTPILLLTARDAPDDIVRGLDAGADDYLTKPFAFDVLLARLRARTRQAAPAGARRRFADLTIDLERSEAWRGKTPLRLSRTEFSILECLMRSAGRIVTRDQLIETVWADREVSNNNLDVFIRFLRVKVDLPGHRKLIRTERGVGYSLRDDEC